MPWAAKGVYLPGEATTADGMVADAHKLRAIIPDLVVKIPVTAEGLAAIKLLTAEGDSDPGHRGVRRVTGYSPRWRGRICGAVCQSRRCAGRQRYSDRL